MDIILTTLTIIAALVGVIAGIVQVIDYLQKQGSKRKKDRIPKEQGTSIPLEPKTQFPSAFSEARVIAQFNLTREKVSGKIHRQATPICGSYVLDAFTSLNERRKALGLEILYDAQRFRPTNPPDIRSTGVIINVSPINYAITALMKNEETSATIKKHIQDQLQKSIRGLPRSLRSHTYIESQGYNLIGTGTCLITADNKLLLRKRGLHVVRGTKKWDVSISGHPAMEDINQDNLDFARTVQRETLNELGQIAGDPRNIVFTGIVELHPEKIAGDMNLLAVWTIENTAAQLSSIIHPGKAPKDTAFSTTSRTRETFVWDTENLFVEFDGPIILQSLEQFGIDLQDFVPEALICIELALIALNRKVLEIFKSA